MEIEDNFPKNALKLRGVDYSVLDVKVTRWHDDCSLFKNQMKDMALMYTNVVSSSFESVRTVLSTIESLDNFYILATRKRIKAFVEAVRRAEAGE